MMEWSAWLQELVTWNGVERMTRARAIRRFVQEGLLPLLQAHGYTIAATRGLFMSRIATGLWLNQGKSCLESNWRFGHELQRGWRQEDLYRFDEVLGVDVWDAFWLTWGRWCDVDDSGERGHDRRIDIQDYIWTQLDLYASPQTAVVNEILGFGADGADGWRTGATEDVYLREQAETGEYDGYRKPKP